jgi:hypothetical protein
VTVAEQLEPAAPARLQGEPARVDDAPAGAPVARMPRRRLTNLVIALVALSPFVVGIWSIVSLGFPEGALFGDRALLGLSAVDAWRAPVLLGPYSRFYWHHPGPLYFYVLNVVSSLLGGQTVGLVLAAVSINVAATTGILVVAFRRGGRFLLLWTSILLTLYLFAIDPIPFDIWNPSATLIPFVLVLLLAWGVACGDWWAAPWLALVASFAVQTHVGLAPGVAMAIVFPVVVGVLRQRRRPAPLADAERRTIGRAALTSVGIAFVAWLPPLIQQFTSSDGNLSALVRFFGQPGTPHTYSEGLTNTGLQATLIPRSLFEPVSLLADAHHGLGLAVVVSAVAFVVAVVAARKARATDAVVLLTLVAIELLVGVYAVTRIVGPIQFYLVQWISAVGLVLWIAVGHALVAYARGRWSAAPNWPTVTRVVSVVLFVGLCIGAVRAFPSDAGRMNEDLDVPNNRQLFGYVPTKQLLAATRPGQVVVLRLDSITSWEVMAADALLLVQHGRRVEVVDVPVTRLLFDDSLRVHAPAPGSQIIAFRDRAHPHVGTGEALLARQGQWSLVNIPPR